MTTRIERDTLGEVAVPADRLWGAQTQRSLENFPISGERMPRELLHALVEVKRACATVNVAHGTVRPEIAQAIVAACDEVLEGRHADEFPLVVWQTGSGTQTNMNVNEVLANRASELLGGTRGPSRLVHPNDDVNRSQSSNDVIPTALHVAAAVALVRRVVPSVNAVHETLRAKAESFADVVKIGRTHLMDATPLTLGNEVSGWSAQFEHARLRIEATLPGLLALAIGGTAVGTGLNAPRGFGEAVAAELAVRLDLPFVAARNRFEALATGDAMVFAHGALRTLAVSCIKVANDVRLLASGPRCGIGEIRIPANEPGSSIMPGKVNPTQAEALLQCAAQVVGNDVTITLSGTNGQLELNVARPLLAHAFLQSTRLLGDALASFDQRCLQGLEPDRARIATLLERSLMLVTALAPQVGYDAAARIAKHAHEHGLSLREAALALGAVSAEDFDRWVKPEKMLG